MFYETCIFTVLIRFIVLLIEEVITKFSFSVTKKSIITSLWHFSLRTTVPIPLVSKIYIYPFELEQ